MKNIQKLQESLIVLKAEASKIINSEEELNDELLAELETITAKVESTTSSISVLQNAENSIASINDSAGRVSAPTVPAEPISLETKQDGWKTAGEFYNAVFKAGNKSNPMIDPRLITETDSSIFGNEASGADGGFSIPELFDSTIRKHSLEEGSFLAMTDNTPISSNIMNFPTSEETPWSTGGVRTFWAGEGASTTTTKPNLKQITLQLGKLFSFVDMTDELLSDSAAMESYVTQRIGEAIKFATNDALVNGNGTGKPLGVLNSGALVSVSRVAGNLVDEVDVSKMYERMPDATNGVWLINHGLFNQLMVMTVGNQPVFVPSSAGFTGAPGGFLFGRPVILTQTCQALGTKGDIFFVDWKNYLTITKSGGINMASSIHLHFDQDITSFRATFRVAGQTRYSSPISAKNGNDLSHFVTLAA